jgi:hypothetical protein
MLGFFYFYRMKNILIIISVLFVCLFFGCEKAERVAFGSITSQVVDTYKVYCIKDQLLIGAYSDGTWELRDWAPSGNTVDSFLVGDNPCIQFTTQPFGDYPLEYTVCRTRPSGVEICRTTRVYFRHLDLGEFPIPQITKCATDAAFNIADEFQVRFGPDAIYDVTSTSAAFTDLGHEYSTFDPASAEGYGIYSIFYDIDPFAPPNYRLDPETVDATEELFVEIVSTGNAGIIGDTTFCAGDSVQLFATGGTSFTWSTGDTTQSIWATSATSYTVTVTACDANTTSATQAVTQAASFSVSIDKTPADTMCQGSTTLLDVDTSGLTYEWSNGEVTESILIEALSDADQYFTVTVTDSDGCGVTATDTVHAFSSIAVTQALTGVSVDSITGNVFLCNGETGAYTIHWSGGHTDYEFKVKTYRVSTANLSETGWVNYGTNDSLNQTPLGADPETYNITFLVRDSCLTIDSIEFDIVHRESPTITSITGVTNFSTMDTFQICYTAGRQYAYTWNATAGPYDYTVTRGVIVGEAPAAGSPVASGTSVSNSFSIFTLHDGIYRLDITDANGCTASDSIYVIMDTDKIVYALEDNNSYSFSDSCYVEFEFSTTDSLDITCTTCAREISFTSYAYIDGGLVGTYEYVNVQPDSSYNIKVALDASDGLTSSSTVELLTSILDYDLCNGKQDLAQSYSITVSDSTSVADNCP